MTNDEKEYKRYEDYNKRYSDIYKGLKSYSDSKAKYILMISGVGILTILNILEKDMFKKEVCTAPKILDTRLEVQFL